MSDEFTPIDWNSNSTNEDFFAGYDEARIPVHVPAGKYIAILTGWKTDRNKNNTPCVKLSYQIASGDYSGQIITEQRFLTKSAMGYTKQFFDSMKLDPRRSVSDYPEIWVELVTTIQDGVDGRSYTNVQSVRRIVPPEGQTPVQTSRPVPGSGSSSQSQGTVPGAF